MFTSMVVLGKKEIVRGYEKHHLDLERSREAARQARQAYFDIRQRFGEANADRDNVEFSKKWYRKCFKQVEKSINMELVLEERIKALSFEDARMIENAADAHKYNVIATAYLEEFGAILENSASYRFPKYGDPGSRVFTDLHSTLMESVEDNFAQVETEEADGWDILPSTLEFGSNHLEA